MFFRNLVFFRFPYLETSLLSLQDLLEECRLKPIGGLELSSRGFVSPFGRGDDALLHECGRCQWLSIGGEDRILPAAVVNELLAKKLAEIEEREGRVPSGRARKRIKDDLLVELIPRAFVAPSRVDAYLDLGRGFIAVDTSSRKTAENVVSEIRRALGSFPALPLNAEVAPRAVLTSWLAGEALPDGWSLGDECELRDAITNGAVVRVANEELLSDEIAKHLESGKQCTRLALNFEDHLELVIGEDLVIRKLRFLDGAVDQLENCAREDIRAELDARFALMTGEIGKLFDALETAFKLSRLDEGQVKPRSTGGTITVSAIQDGKVSASATFTEDEFRQAGDALQRYAQAVSVVRASGNTTISHLQRHLKCGYNAAARLIEAMEERGVVSAPDARGKRALLHAGAL